MGSLQHVSYDVKEYDSPKPKIVLESSRELEPRTLNCTLRFPFFATPVRLRKRLYSFHAGSIRKKLNRLLNKGIPCLYMVGGATSTPSSSSIS